MKKTNKKAMEVSINVLVGIILGILMLSAGIALFYKIFDRSNEVSLEVDQALKEKMLQSFDEGDLLFLPQTDFSKGEKTIQAIYGIHNIKAEPETFKVIATSLSTAISQEKIVYIKTPIEIPSKEKEIQKIVINTKGLPKGQHGVKLQIQSLETTGYENYADPKIIWINIK